MMTSKRQLGQAAEQQAANYLSRHGLQLIQRNYQCRMGEIDLIMRDKNCLVFVEVRYRHQDSHGHGVETVTFMKQKKLIRTASFYLQQKNLWEKVPCRFDVVAIANAENRDILWIKDAFQVQY